MESVSKFSKGFKIFGIATWIIINGLILISFLTKIGPNENIHIKIKFS